MNEQFTAYLKGIGMSDVLIGRVETIHGFYQGICPEEITDVFVGEHVEADGTKRYESVWFFSQRYLMEAKSFTLKDDFDMTPLHKAVTNWKIEKQEYDFAMATEKSRVLLNVSFRHMVTGELRASKENCDCLREVLRKHIIPNLVC